MISMNFLRVLRVLCGEAFLDEPAVLRPADQSVRGAAAAARVRDADAAAHPVAHQSVRRAGFCAGALHGGGRLLNASRPSVLLRATDAGPQGAVPAVDHAPPDPRVERAL